MRFNDIYAFSERLQRERVQKLKSARKAAPIKAVIKLRVYTSFIWITTYVQARAKSGKNNTRGQKRKPIKR